jgi:hypothetical protein
VVRQLTVFTSDKARIAADIIDQLAKASGAGAAQRWFFNADPILGIQVSPLMALKAGREQEVRAAAAALIDERNGRVAA